MCGLFGAIRCSDPTHAAFVVDVVLALGTQSEERGVDSAGLTMIVAASGHREITEPLAAHAASKVAGMDQTFTVKDEGKFSDIDFTPYGAVLDKPTLFIGHTRWATQGTTKDLANASPMYAGALIATHNGDVETSTLPKYKELREQAFGDTDSEILFLALDRSRADRRGMTRVLRQVNGRAALAFYDRSRPSRLYLARTGLAPLCYTYDQHGNFYYASNPDWFRRIARKNPDVEFDDIILIPEGHLLTVDTLTGDITDTRRFTPTVRESDMNLMNLAAYRGFTPEDRAVDMQLHRHRIVQPPMSKWPTLTAVPNVIDVPKTETAVTAPSAASQARIPSETPRFGAGPGVTQYNSFKDYYAARESGSISNKQGFHVSHDSRLDSRLDSEEPEVWDREDQELDDELNGDEGEVSVFLYNDDEVERLSEEYDKIDWEEIENLCWNTNGSDFDHTTYNAIFEADPEEALKFIADLRENAETNPTSND